MGRKVIHLYTGPDGESHFEDIVIPVANKWELGLRSESVKAKKIMFQEQPDDYNSDWHPAPRRQFIITLEGEGEIEIGDGTKRRFKPGDILLAEDTTGRGHISRGIKNKPRKAIVVTLE